MTRLLVTGFDLWGSVTVNPSWEIIKDLPNKAGEVDISIRKISVIYSKIQDEMDKAIRELKPDLVIAFGLSESIPKPRVETYGWNYGASGKDAAGIAKNGMLINEPTARIGYKTTFDYSHVEKWLVGSGFEAYHSDDAGDFLCNANIYYGLKSLDDNRLQSPYMFIHVPSFSTMSLDKQKSFARLIIQKALAELNINIKLTDLNANGSNAETPPSPEPEKPVDPTPSESKHGFLQGVSDRPFNATNLNTRYSVQSPLEAGKYVFKGQIDNNRSTEVIVKLFLSEGSTQRTQDVFINLKPGSNNINQVISLDKNISNDVKFNVEYKDFYDKGAITIISDTISLAKEGADSASNSGGGSNSEPSIPTPPTPEPTEPDNPVVNEPETPKAESTNAIEKNLITNASASDYTKVCDYATNTVSYRGDTMPKDNSKFLFKVKIDSNHEANLSLRVPNFTSATVPLKVGEHDYEILVWTELDARSLERANMSNAYTLEIKGSMRSADKLTIKGGSVEFGKLVDQSYVPSNPS